jgi:opacity protein-like surface antigen
MRMNHFLGLAAAALMTMGAAQADDAASPAPGANAATGADIYVYPANGQSDRQLDRDRYECHGWAGKQTGYDPTQASLAPNQRVQVAAMPPDHRGAVNGAVAGAVIGATVSAPPDSAGGAMVGAVAGAVLGAAVDTAHAREAAGNASRQSAAEQAEQARLDKQAYDYRRAITACLEGRGYTVR